MTSFLYTKEKKEFRHQNNTKTFKSDIMVVNGLYVFLTSYIRHNQLMLKDSRCIGESKMINFVYLTGHLIARDPNREESRICILFCKDAIQRNSN